MSRVSEAAEWPSRSGLGASHGHDVTHLTRQSLHGRQIMILGLLHLEGGGNACVGWWYTSGNA